MPTEQDVDNAKQDNLTGYDATLERFAALQNAASRADSATMEPCMKELRQQRTDIAVQSYIDALNAPACQRAIDRIRRATRDMDRMAQDMTTVAGFLTNAPGFLSAGRGVITGLRGF